MIRPLSTLSIRHRSLKGSTQASPSQLQAKRVAADLLTHNGSPRHKQQAIDYIHAELGSCVSSADEYITLVLPPVLRNALVTLPAPYGLKGGAARELLGSLAHHRPLRHPRDIDVIRQGSSAVPNDSEIARTYMPLDYRHGARVELIRSMQQYLASRDVTVNELAVFSNSLSVSILGALDTLGHTIRPSRYRGGSIHRQPSLDGRIFLKAVRLFAEAENAGDPAELVGIPDTVAFSEVDLALHLDKAFQRNTNVARSFVDTLVLLGALPASREPLTALLDELDHLRYGENGLLPHAPKRDTRPEPGP